MEHRGYRASGALVGLRSVLLFWLVVACVAGAIACWSTLWLVAKGLADWLYEHLWIVDNAVCVLGMTVLAVSFIDASHTARREHDL